MAQNKETATVLDKGVYIIHGEEKLKTSDFTTSFNSEKIVVNHHEKKRTFKWNAVATASFIHYSTLIVLGFLTWGLLWTAWGDGWKHDGDWFRLAVVVVIAWGSGQILQGVTTLPPLLAALLTGILARHLDYLDMRMFPQIDGFLRLMMGRSVVGATNLRSALANPLPKRIGYIYMACSAVDVCNAMHQPIYATLACCGKIYPVIILGKSSLAWDAKFMKSNWRQVASLGAVPWTVEVITLTICTRYFLDYPWVWGLLLGSIYASLSCAVVMPTVLRDGVSPHRTRNWPQLVCTAGGTDTALSVGVYGIVYSYIFCDVDDTYRYTKVALTLLVGAALGVAWGRLASLIPHTRDLYVTELRVLLVLLGGLFGNFITLYLGWGGAGGVAVLACNATAATYWARDGWKLNNNPASTVYRVLWSSLEPALFAYTGTYFVISSTMSKTLLVGFGILLICLAVRLSVAMLMCWSMTLREKVFICCTWIPKSIVEAVLCPLAINTLILQGNHNTKEMEHAEQLMKLIVQAILITTPVGYLLTNHLAPILLKDLHKNNKNDSEA